ncbi:MAG: hypothetical protein MJ102_07160, partial [Clostridia bacterium]|nr:hypothetical protein [Clostridia bacterium]
TQYVGRQAGRACTLIRGQAEPALVRGLRPRLKKGKRRLNIGVFFFQPLTVGAKSTAPTVPPRFARQAGRACTLV